jgi:hypothetical protein
MRKISSGIIKFKDHFFSGVHTYRYHHFRKLIAEKYLRELESVKGKTDKKLIKLSDEYAKEVLGSKCYAPWLYVNCAVNNCFREGWIPDNYYDRVVLPVFNGGYGKTAVLRPLAKHLFRSDVFPEIAYHVNRLFLSSDYRILNEDELMKLLFNNRDNIVFKIDYSHTGTGIFLFERSNFDIKKVKMSGNGVFQYYIEQHPFFSELMPSSVSTIRITTYFENNGIVSVRGCFLRVARSTDQNVKWASNILIPVDPVNGELNELGYFLNFHTTDRHPDTQVVFAERFIPFFSKCISTAKELHRQMPFCRCIGWDMIVDKYNNIKVMEWNGAYPDIIVHEAIQGPCFTDLGWENLWKNQSKDIIQATMSFS